MARTALPFSPANRPGCLRTISCSSPNHVQGPVCRSGNGAGLSRQQGVRRRCSEISAVRYLSPLSFGKASITSGAETFCRGTLRTSGGRYLSRRRKQAGSYSRAHRFSVGPSNAEFGYCCGEFVVDTSSPALSGSWGAFSCRLLLVH